MSADLAQNARSCGSRDCCAFFLRSRTNVRARSIQEWSRCPVLAPNFRFSRHRTTSTSPMWSCSGLYRYFSTVLEYQQDDGDRNSPLGCALSNLLNSWNALSVLMSKNSVAGHRSFFSGSSFRRAMPDSDPSSISISYPFKLRRSRRRSSYRASRPRSEFTGIA